MLTQDEHREACRVYMQKYRSKPENREKIRQQNAEYRKRKKEESIRQTSEIDTLENTMDIQRVKIGLLESQLKEVTRTLELYKKEIEIPENYLTTIKDLQDQLSKAYSHIKSQNEIISQLQLQQQQQQNNNNNNNIQQHQTSTSTTPSSSLYNSQVFPISNIINTSNSNIINNNNLMTSSSAASSLFSSPSNSNNTSSNNLSNLFLQKSKKQNTNHLEYSSPPSSPSLQSLPNSPSLPSSPFNMSPSISPIPIHSINSKSIASLIHAKETNPSASQFSLVPDGSLNLLINTNTNNNNNSNTNNNSSNVVSTVTTVSNSNFITKDKIEKPLSPSIIKDNVKPSLPLTLDILCNVLENEKYIENSNGV